MCQFVVYHQQHGDVFKLKIVWEGTGHLMVLRSQYDGCPPECLLSSCPPTPLQFQRTWSFCLLAVNCSVFTAYRHSHFEPIYWRIKPKPTTKELLLWRTEVRRCISGKWRVSCIWFPAWGLFLLHSGTECLLNICPKKEIENVGWLTEREKKIPSCEIGIYLLFWGGGRMLASHYFMFWMSGHTSTF